MNQKVKYYLLIGLLVFTTQQSLAKEGMWLPLLLKSIEGDMQSMGLKLSAEDIYDVNQSSLKDAVISFGGFCTGEVISNQGLILTNHHCGYGRIQSHSSVENDYLTDGYWAKNQSEELKNPGLTATFIVRMEDVTDAVLGGMNRQLIKKERDEIIEQRIDSLTEVATKDTHYEAYIRPFYYGNEYYMFVTETFKDVRLVGAPPSSIGKFGGDTDNWIWPRHTGDFSLFRIYADKDNKPAEYAEDNVPYRPKHYFPISMEGADEGDFTMVFGFPGRTEEYLTSDAIRQIKEVINPARIAIREKALEIMDEQMKASDKVRIQYASKYARVSNYWKKWIGENRGLEKSSAIAKKEKEEAIFKNAINGEARYDGLIEAIAVELEALEPYSLARNYFIEIPYRKLEILWLASRFRNWFDEESEEKPAEEEINEMIDRLDNHFKDYHSTTDSLLSNALLTMYRNDLSSDFVPAFLKDGEVEKKVAKLYEKSIFNSHEELKSMLESGKWKKIEKLTEDPAYRYMDQLYDMYYEAIRPVYSEINYRLDSLNQLYLEGLRKRVEDNYYPDANSTLRLAYGKVEDYDPRDGVEYHYFTTTNGIMQKYDPGSRDFELPDKLVNLIRDEDFGDYADEDGFMHVCFIASNHTTGGNSGSPVINGNGELIGLNFDRNWEGTMSDINYDIDLCRNISVDIRYVLFVVDKFAGATHLIDEMKLVRADEQLKE